MSHSSILELRETLGGRNLYLIGMMGSGKTSTGPFLAKALQYGFVDSDAVIEQLLGLSISEIFKDKGESGFREIESKVLQSIGERHSLVVSTGGGVVTKNENWGVLHQGIVIWIDASSEVLLKRLNSDKDKRPLLFDKDIDFFEKLLAKRQPLYCEADLHIKVENQSQEIVAENILELLANIVNSSKVQGEQQTIVD